jgi:hypothetical protein
MDSARGGGGACDHAGVERSRGRGSRPDAPPLRPRLGGARFVGPRASSISTRRSPSSTAFRRRATRPPRSPIRRPAHPTGIAARRRRCSAPCSARLRGISR